MIKEVEIPKGYKQTEFGVIPKDWVIKQFGDFVITYVAGDLKSDRFSEYQDDNYKYPVFSNTVSNSGLYGYYNYPEYSGDSLTVVGRGVGLGTAFTRKGGYGAIGRLLILFPDNNIDSKFLTEYINHRVNIFSESGGIPQLTGISFSKYRIPLPPTKSEQTAIATALSDTDALIENLEKLIAKKRYIKQGVMQRLLNPKPHWKLKKLGELAQFLKGKGLAKSVILSDGKYKCIHYGELFTKYSEVIKLILSCTNEKNNAFYSTCNDVLMPTSDVTPNGLATASCIMEDNVILGGDILIIRAPEKILNGVYLSYCITKNKGQIMQLVSGSTVYHIYGNDMKKFEFYLPSIEEQIVIARILTNIDDEITALEQKLHKATCVKQGMMQVLLTGKIRLL